MKKIVTVVSVFLWGAVSCVLSAVPNEWTFKQDSARLTLSQAENTGTDPSAFSDGGEGFLETDGVDGLLCTHSGSGPDGMWTSGAILNATLSAVPEPVQYLRCDLNYNLRDVAAGNGMVLEFSFTDEQKTKVAGMAFMSMHGDGSPSAEKVLKPVTTNLATVGRLSVIIKVDISNQTTSVWYDPAGSNNFDPGSPDLLERPISLSSIDNLKFHATGDYRAEGSDNYLVVDNLRMASSWEEITRPVYLPLSVNPLFARNMVLQRNRSVPIWGQVSPGQEVTVQLDGQVVGRAVSDENGAWDISMAPRSADGGVAHVILITSGDQSIQISDVIFGDVFLASGQSNMARTMDSAGVVGYADELAVANNYPLIRQIDLTAQLDTDAVQPNWEKCGAGSLRGFTATGYFFAKQLYLQTEVPVGLIFFAWGGQVIERFLCPEGMDLVPELSGMQQAQEQGGLENLYVYNPLVESIVPYGIRGAVWYQGEANSGDGDLYRFKMRALLRGWRTKWHQGDFPFYYVQLAALNENRRFPGIRQAQLDSLSETNSGMVVTIDIGDEFDVHPGNKFDTGLRLAKWVLAKDMGHDLQYSGPLYHKVIQEEAQVRVLFDYAENGLFIGQKDGTNVVEEVEGPLQNFQVAGADKHFVDASAMIDRDTVVVSSPSVPEPMYVRYCYAMWPEGSNKLYNAGGLPASPFRTDGGYSLQITSGSGGASELRAGDVATVTADAPESGMVFDRWIGAAAEIQSLNASTTTVVMPDHALYLLATYRDAGESDYLLTVNGGAGGGHSKAGSILNIEAAAPSAGQQFECWSGDTQTIVDVSLPHTTLRMPEHDITIVAVYRMVDSVGDGIDDAWRSTCFGGDGTWTNELSSADADPDGDGMTNWQEFRAGTSPIDAESAFFLRGFFGKRSSTLTFFGKAGSRYRLERTDTLAPPLWKPILYNMYSDAGGEVSYSETNQESCNFYRVLLDAD